jgi:hypothetical protein
VARGACHRALVVVADVALTFVVCEVSLRVAVAGEALCGGGHACFAVLEAFRAHGDRAVVVSSQAWAQFIGIRRTDAVCAGGAGCA